MKYQPFGVLHHGMNKSLDFGLIASQILHKSCLQLSYQLHFHLLYFLPFPTGSEVDQPGPEEACQHEHSRKSPQNQSRVVAAKLFFDSISTLGVEPERLIFFR